jgi:hypothetical protein
MAKNATHPAHQTHPSHPAHAETHPSGATHAESRQSAESRAASHPLDHNKMKSPGTVAAIVNATAGHVVVDWWGQLDPARAEKQLNAFSGFQGFRPNGPLSRGITDPSWSPDDFSHACGLSTS